MVKIAQMENPPFGEGGFSRAYNKQAWQATSKKIFRMDNKDEKNRQNVGKTPSISSDQRGFFLCLVKHHNHKVLWMQLAAVTQHLDVFQ
ncbi:MAG: hypothetical protein F4W91_11675 [Gemmatimonadetes bacterium]|nr:hypothetical protein [Gemmatimonadota bacterium]